MTCDLSRVRGKLLAEQRRRAELWDLTREVGAILRGIVLGWVALFSLMLAIAAIAQWIWGLG